MSREDFFEEPCGSSRKYKRKYLVISCSVILLAVLSAVTLAYVFVKTDGLKNVFNPSIVGCKVEESFDGTVKKDVSVRNTGDVTSYVRATVIVTWMSEDKNQVSAVIPEEGSDYTVEYGDSVNWEKAEDGYWYYKIPVDAGETTDILISDCRLTSNATVHEGFCLSVEIVASSIQVSPVSVVKEQWQSGVFDVDDGVLILRKGE